METFYFPVPLSDNAAGMSYCCGPDPTSCCQNGGAFQIPVGQIVLRPVQLLASSSGSSTSTATGSTLTPSTRTSLSSTSMPTNPAAPANGSSSKSLAVGLGVGIPFGLILIGAILFAAFELRRFNGSRAGPVGYASAAVVNETKLPVAGMDIQSAVRELPEPNTSH